jgi:hypothetical protein
VKHSVAYVASLASAVAGLSMAFAQQPPPGRTHRVIEKGELHPVPATSTPQFDNEVRIEIVGDERVITTNGIPNHKTGPFPNRGNPNRMSSRSQVYHVPAKPKRADEPTPLRGEFGVALNGVPFDPGAAEFYQGAAAWQYEPLSGAIDLGIDESNAHVQPNGKYHYHGLPNGLLKELGFDPQRHSPLVGWAADGFPIYAVCGYRDPKDAKSGVQKLTSSYQVNEGKRPGGKSPAGEYDGTFVADYEYVPGSGDLDECNGRQTVTPEFPEGTYAYFLTEHWPVVPRMFRGTPSDDFRHGPPAGGDRQSGLGVAGGPRGRLRGGPPRPGQVLPPFVQDELELTAEQKQQLAELQDEVDARLAKLLTDEQRRRLEDPRNFGPPGGPEREGPRFPGVPRGGNRP